MPPLPRRCAIRCDDQGIGAVVVPDREVVSAVVDATCFERRDPSAVGGPHPVRRIPKAGAVVHPLLFAAARADDHDGGACSLLPTADENPVAPRRPVRVGVRRARRRRGDPLN